MKAPTIAGASQLGLSTSSGFSSSKTGRGRLSFLFLRMRDFGMGGRLHEGRRDGNTDLGGR